MKNWMEKKEMENNNYNNIIGYLKIALFILLIIGAGTLMLNQFFGWFYKAELLVKPCDACLKYNENISLCPKIISGNFNLSPSIDIRLSNLTYH